MSTGANLRSLQGCLLGCAVGDAIGLPYEGLSRRRVQRLVRLPLRHRFVAGRGMVSDDTDHTVFVAQALITSKLQVEPFRRALAWRLRWWLLCLPAGIGWATLRAILRLWLGLRRSGVWSAGNGPSMRSAIIGAAVPDDAQRRQALVAASTTLTHTDPKALAAALAVAEVTARVAAGAWSTKPAVAEFLTLLGSITPDSAWQRCVQSIGAACTAPEPMAAAEAAFGGKGGVSGYAWHSVPFALVAWYHHFGDFRATLESVVLAGGDVDTVAAMAGAMAGAVTGTQGMPPDWIADIADWPHSTGYLQQLAQRLQDGVAPVSTHFAPALFVRGIVFTLLVLAHGFRRLAPPY